MGGAAGDGGRHHRRLFPDEPDRASFAEVRHAVSGRGADVVRRDGRQYRGGLARHRRDRVVRRPDLFRVQGRAGPGADVLSGRGSFHAFELARPVGAGLVFLPVHVAVPASDLPQRHGDDPQVHRFLRAGRLHRDVRAGDLDIGADRHFQPVAAAQPAGRRLGDRSYGECGDADRRLLRGTVAQFRRLLPFRAGREGDEGRQFPGASGQFHRLCHHHRHRHRRHRQGIRRGDHGSRQPSSSASAIPG